ncbi:MAG: hypothetical protein CV087_09615 [Candidatus Brocadia sp. WS118]|nr:MAG: hypothetical protein CV087_09615 [Candidatus Brocadia sp. WS118]
MTPFHPKFRRALLADPEHRRRGLTSRNLKNYEALNKDLEYEVYYPPVIIEQYGITTENLDAIAAAIAERFKTPDSYETRLARIKEQLQTILDVFYESEEEFLSALASVLDSNICKTNEELRNTVLQLARTEVQTPGAQSGQELQLTDPIRDLINFREEFMPNFDKIRDQFVRNQLKAIDRGYYELNVLKIVNLSFLIFRGWFANIPFKKISEFFARRKGYEKKNK